MFESCGNCQMRVIFGGREYGGKKYCSVECEWWARHPGYCSECVRVTTDESSGGTYTLNGIGTKLYFRRQTCPTCGSCVQTKFFCIFYIPVIPLGSYRVRWATPKRFFSRRVLKNAALPVSVS
ncbi:MAG TPA: hypothetical protein VE620_00140 [Myxococcales bacterium]|nr:hypothetical protein [Myxococcales bacterium]